MVILYLLIERKVPVSGWLVIEVDVERVGHPAYVVGVLHLDAGREQV